MARKKPKNKLVRKPKNFTPSPRILIVCEGEKTEPDYFKFLRNKFRLNVADVEVRGDGGSSPKSVYEFALELYNKSKKGVVYDMVFCVYDQDEFSKHAEVKNKIDQQKAFSLIFSNPCFEIWYLFHFVNSTKPYTKKGRKTASQQVKSDIEKILKNFQENYLDILFERINVAITNAKNSEKQGIENPYTNVYELVEELSKHRN